MPPWFKKLMEGCEALSLDSDRDRDLLWHRLKGAWPHAAIEAMISDNLDSTETHLQHEYEVARIKAAVITALEES